MINRFFNQKEAGWSQKALNILYHPLGYKLLF